MNLTISNIPQYSGLYLSKRNSKKLANKNAKNANCSFLALESLAAQRRKFIIHDIRYKDIDYFDKFLAKKGRVSKEEFEEIKRYHPSLFSMAQRYCMENFYGRTTPNDLAHVTIDVDNYLKSNFKNYRIISLGTSPAPISEQLASMGNEVIFVPVSGMRYYRDSKIEEFPELETLMHYLDFKNINDGKLNILIDYTASGATLKAMGEVIKEYFKMDDDKVKTVSITDDIIRELSTLAQRRVLSDMANSDMEKISNVPHFPITPHEIGRYDFLDKKNTIYLKNYPKENIFEVFDNSSTPLARTFSLCTMNQCDKMLNNF